jgi:hypothetical protein
MSSTKFLVAMVVLTAFVAGPVLAQTESPATGGSAGSSMSSDHGTTNSDTTKAWVRGLWAHERGAVSTTH